MCVCQSVCVACECSVSGRIIRVLMLMCNGAYMRGSMSALVCVAGRDDRTFPAKLNQTIIRFLKIRGTTLTHSTREVLCCTMLWHQITKRKIIKNHSHTH